MAEVQAERLQKWLDNLLDLSAGNPLLSHRGEKSCLRIECPDPSLLKDRLAEGNPIRIVSYPRQESDVLPIDKFAEKELKKQPAGVVVDLPEEELSKRSVQLFRKAKLALEEGGVGILYMVFGFLVWRKEDEDKDRRAPLILVPVRLERKSAREGVRIVASDDEPRMNLTLMEKLAKDHGVDIPSIGGELLFDEYGFFSDENEVDIEKIWKVFSEAISHIKNFCVTDDVLLGNFSFSKHLMWADLKNHSETMAKSNMVVKHLMCTPTEDFIGGGEPVEARTLDEKFHPSDLLMPLDGDSSQTVCVAEADAGKNFIIIGPPGTGKSQTISNIISHMLGKGKTVLFVSEKMAALDVVHRRLEEIGLGKFCLELHSHKANKKAVLAQLKEASEASEADDVFLRFNDEIWKKQIWKKQSLALLRARNKLNRYAQALHSKRRNGHSMFEGIGFKLKYSDPDRRVKLEWHSADAHSSEDLEALEQAARDLRLYGQPVDPASDVYEIVAFPSWGASLEKQLVEKAETLAKFAEECESAVVDLASEMGTIIDSMDSRQIESLAKIGGLLERKEALDACRLLSPELSSGVTKVRTFASLLETYRETEERLSCPYSDFKWRELDIFSLREALRTAVDSWWLSRKMKLRKLKKDLRPVSDGKPDPLTDIPALGEMSELDTKIVSLGKKLGNLDAPQGHESDMDLLMQTAETADRMQTAAQILETGMSSWGSSLARKAEGVNISEESWVCLLNTFDRFRRSAEDFRSADSAYSRVSQVSPVAMRRFSKSPEVLNDIATAARNLSRNIKGLRDWYRWTDAKQKAEDLGLGNLTGAIEKGCVKTDEAHQVFLSAYWDWWTDVALDSDPVLYDFYSSAHEDTITLFRRLDRVHQDNTVSYINRQIAKKIDSRRNTKKSSDWGKLQRYMGQIRPRIPIRKLAEQYHDILTSLAPCWMMSPLSVSQYLPVGRGDFDVVIFDEASQITPWDAIGAMARGKQVIVAGDPQQMPPTSFFQRQSFEEDEWDESEDSIPDQESILDEMEKARIPDNLLKFHYRSEKEDLIAFSNERYYGNKLITFPFPNKARGVSLVRSEGFYDAGKSRTNKIEAHQIVDEIVRRVQHKYETVRNQSIGVVTFNLAQQSLIEDLLDEKRMKEQQVEEAFSGERVEPVFVKNLETVQGDERDVILFSVGYGPDRAGGRPAMRFGPLNREGGHRRLNVAATRARQEMKIFTSLYPEHIRKTQKNPRGVRDLKDFLQFAEEGPGALGAQTRGSLDSAESPFEEEVIVSLTEKLGWEVESQIGVSNYRIDIGVIHPDKKGEYLAGIECDGVTYHSSFTAQERDNLRQQRLEACGWRILRIWSPDWWHNRERAEAVIHRQLSALLENDRRSTGQPPAA